MKKNLLLSFAAMFALTASAAEFPVTFTDGMPANWSVGQGCETSVSDGHLNVKMVVQSNGTYRGDLMFSSSNESTDYKVDASEYKVLAIKFIGDKPDQNNTLEIQYRTATGTSWMNSEWKNKSFTTMTTTGGNTICYWDLTKDSQWTGELSINKINFKIADNVTSTEYTIDWINVYPSVEAIEKDWQDDGNADSDEGSVATFPVMIGSEGYNNLRDAFDAVKENETITVNESQEVTGNRITVAAKGVTVRCAEGVTISDKVNAGQLLFLINGEIIFDGVTFVGNNESKDKYIIETSGSGAKCTLNDVVFRNFNSTQGIVQAKSSGAVTLNGVVFENCTLPENTADVFIGSGGSSISGDNNLSIMLQNKNRIDATGVNNTLPVKIYLTGDRGGDNTIVTGCDDPTQFILMGMAGKKLVKGDNSTLVLADDNESGVAGIEAEEGVAEFYNLQGLRVAEDNLTDGVYIVRKGNKTAKVMIRK